MDNVVIQQYLEFFQDFLKLCLLGNWPTDDSSENEIRNAFLVAQHVEQCLDKLLKRNILNKFLASLKCNDDQLNGVVKYCLKNPPRYILKKIITSETKVTQMDIGFRTFLEIFGEEKLDRCLLELMREAASKDTLIKNMHKELPKEKILEFKSYILLSELNDSDNSKIKVLDMLKDCNQDTLELLTHSMLSKNEKFHKTVNNIVNAFLEYMSYKNQSCKKFWKLLFNIDGRYLLQMCLAHIELYKLISRALIDISKLLIEDISAEYFYLDMTYSQLELIVNKICQNSCLKQQLFDILHENNCDIELWQNMLS